MKIIRQTIFIITLVCMTATIGFGQAPDDGEMGNGTRCETCFTSNSGGNDGDSKQANQSASSKKAEDAASSDESSSDYFINVIKDLFSQIFG